MPSVKALWRWKSLWRWQFTVPITCHFPQENKHVPFAETNYEARNDDTNNSETILSCNDYVCAIGKMIPREFLRVIGHSQKLPYGGA